MKNWIRRRVVRWSLRHIVALYRANASYAVLARYGVEDISDDGGELSIIIAKGRT